MMDDQSEFELCEPAPFIYYENGQIAVTDGSSVWLVIVTCEAMKATAPPPGEVSKASCSICGVLLRACGGCDHQG
jgi:hypothetical protein